MNKTYSEMRIDKWLWTARFYKTRSLAAAAVSGGKVHVNGERVKPARPVAPGDDVVIRRGPYEFCIRVHALSARRGPAQEAAALYVEGPASADKRERLAEQLRLERAAGQRPAGRPDKRERRHIIRFIRRSAP